MSELSQCRPVILGLRGPVLTDADRADFARVRPVGAILFARNIETAGQTATLCAELRNLLPPVGPQGEKLIAVDQEGGRVQRLTFNGRRPAAAAVGQLYHSSAEQGLRAAELLGLLLAHDLRQVGATWLMAPCLDLAHAATHAIIGTRAFGEDGRAVAMLAAACLRGIAQGGGLGCLKHAPGHGRATADSHAELPTVWTNADELTRTDWLPYSRLAADQPFIMTAHIAYPTLQGVEGLPATFDGALLHDLRMRWNFDGLWLADDLGMKALGDAGRIAYPERVQRSLAAGCDLLLCCFSKLVHGMAGTVFDEEDFAAFISAIDCLPLLGARALQVLDGLSFPPGVDPEDVHAGEAELMRLLSAQG